MIFPNFPLAANILVDANTLVYDFAPDPVSGTPCSDLLVRIKRKHLHGFTSTHIVSEMAHRLMTLEAIRTLGWRSGKIVQRLGKNPAEVQ